MKQFVITILLFSALSCRTYLDDEKYANSKFDSFILIRNDENNDFSYRSKMLSTADHEIYYPQHFNIQVPKRIKSWSSSSETNYIEYGFLQFILIDAGFTDKDIKIRPWKIVNDEERINRYLDDYYSIKNKNYDYDEKLDSNHQLYTDGKTFILFYNIKKAINFEKVIASFKYVDWN